jgi:hypothetical protein
MVIVLAIGPKARGFKPGRQRWIFRAIKVRSTIPFGVEVQPSVPCCKILRHVKDTSRHHIDIDRQNSAPFLAQFVPASLLGVSAATKEKSGR